MVDRKYPHLFSLLKVGTLTFKNRIVSHGGMEADAIFLNGRRLIGTSATSLDIGLRTEGTSRVELEEMAEALMREIADAYGAAAAMVKLAGSTSPALTSSMR